MQRNTITTLGQLNEGDVFTYQKRADPWHVVKKEGSKVSVNQFLPWGAQIHKYHDVKNAATTIRFLRHKTQEATNEKV